jgi:ABC-type antimicrobial peptide transport system permease subunit
MKKCLRNLGRQKLRTALTISGVSLGIFTLLVLGALSEHFRVMVDDSREYTRGMIRLFTKTNKDGVNPGITKETIDRIRAMDEVLLVEPVLVLWFDGFDLESDPLGFINPGPLVLGLNEEHAQSLRSKARILKGRWLQKGDKRHAMIAEWLALKRDLKIGGKVTIRHKEYELVGIFSAPDVPLVPSGIVPYKPLNDDFIKPQFERAEQFFKNMARRPEFAMVAPLMKAAKLDKKLSSSFVREQQNLFRMYDVIPKDRSDAGTRALALKLRKTVPDLAVIDPDGFAEKMEKAVALFIVLTSIMTVISTVVGGLLIVNTMAMAVIERRREIAIKAAIGATPGQIVREFLVEAGGIGLIGAIIGITLGIVSITIAEPYILDRLENGARIFQITPRLVIIAGLYGVVMGILAGALPASRAARVDPAITLRGL